MNNDHDYQDMYELDAALATVLQAVRAEPLPDDAVARVLSRAKRLDVRASEDSVAVVKPHSRWSRRSLALGASGSTAIAASLIVATFLVSGTSNFSFAEMISAASRRPWVHGVTKYTDGTRTTTSESWVSPAHHLAAMTYGDDRRFEDMEAEISLQYNAKDGNVHKLPILQLQPGRFTEAQAPALLDRLIADKANSHDLFPGERVVKAERHEEERNGKQWLDYLIQLERIDNASINRIVRIRVDRATQLPETWEERRASGSVAMTRFDYPDHGPRSIYDLGVPKTAALIDRVPKGNLAHIVASQRVGRKRFDAYDAIVVQHTDGVTPRYDQLTNVSVKRVRRNNRQYRVDQLLVAKEGLSVPMAGTEMRQWWRENRDRYWAVPQLICNGETTYFYTMLDDHITPRKKPNLTVVVSKKSPVGPPTDDSPAEWPQLMPDQCCRPHLWTSDNTREFAVDPEAIDGPQGTVRLTVTSKSPLHPGEMFRYWFDPGRDDVLRKAVSAVYDRRTNKLAYLNTEEFEEFTQSPNGSWYPQMIRHTASDTPRWQGVTRFFVDFEGELDGELFRPVSEPQSN